MGWEKKVDANPNDGGDQSSFWGMFVDTRHRVSLSKFQVVLWTITTFSLIFGVFAARAFVGMSQPFNFVIPSELLILAGISLGSTAISSAIKSGKDQRNINTESEAMASDKAERTTAAANGSKPDPKKLYRPRFYQLFMVEEGSTKVIDKIMDPTKFQNFLLTLFLIVAFVVSSVNEFDSIEYNLIQENKQAAIAKAEEEGENPLTDQQKEDIEFEMPSVRDILGAIEELPGFDDMNTFFTLLGISHAGYLAGKLPDPKED